MALLRLPNAIEPPSKRRSDAFGFLRLLFATLVIVSHTPELVDGDRSRELLTRLFGTISFGELAVDCFFVISGFFIAGSFYNSQSAGDYLRKRIARILPAFVVAWLLCTLVVAPLGGGTLTASAGAVLDGIVRMVLLAMPPATGAFAGQPYPDLNGAMWTIPFEFRCYLAILLLGMLDLLRRPIPLFLLAAIALTLDAAGSDWLFNHPFLNGTLGQWVIVEPRAASRLASCFLVGACYHALRDKIRLNAIGAGVAIAGLITALCFKATADAGVAVFGGYLIFFIGRAAAGTVLERINNPVDISYGVYLYAWPIEKLLIWWAPNMPLLPLALLTAIGAYAAGWLSWTIVEQPVLSAANRRRAQVDDGHRSKPATQAEAEPLIQIVSHA